jgi:hypothetical protein
VVDNLGNITATSLKIGANTMSFPATAATIARTDAAQTFTGTQTFGSPISGSVTGTAASITGTYSGSLTSSQVTTGLGYTPYNSTNPNGYITSAAVASSYLPKAVTTLTLPAGTYAANTGYVVGSLPYDCSYIVKVIIQVTAGVSYHTANGTSFLDVIFWANNQGADHTFPISSHNWGSWTGTIYQPVSQGAVNNIAFKTSNQLAVAGITFTCIQLP